MVSCGQVEDAPRPHETLNALELVAQAGSLLVQRQALGRLEQQGRYDFAGRLDAVAEHYVRGLTRQGYKLLRNGGDVSGRRELLFAKDRRTVNLVLRKRKRQEKIVVEFTVTVSRPER